MRHLKITSGNSSSIESVSQNLLNKIYELSNSNSLDNLSSIIGRVDVNYLHDKYFDYLVNRYSQLRIIINIDKLIKFEDPIVEQILLDNNLGISGVGIPYSNNITTIPSFKNNTDIVSFNELKLFTNVKNIPSDCFNGCTNLQSIDISNITTMGQRPFYNCTSLNNLGIENFPVPFYGRNSQYWTFYNCTSLGVGKDLDITYSSELTNTAANTFRNTGYKTVTIHGENLVKVHNQGSGEYEPYSGMPNLEKYDISDTKITEIPTTSYFSHATTIISSPYATEMHWGIFSACENIRHYIILSTTVPTTTDDLKYWRIHANTYIYVRDELVEAFKTDEKWSTSPAIVNKIKPLSELPPEVTWYTKDRDFSQYFE